MTIKRMMSLLVFAAVFYLGSLAFVVLFQRNFLYHPSHTYRSPAMVEANEQLREMEIETQDGLNLKGWYAKATSRPFTIVFFHGNADDLASVADLAEPYIRLGYGFLIAEYRGYSAMPGQPSEQGLYKDARSYIRALLASGVKEKNLILFGHSLGTGVAVQMATEFKPAGIMLMAPYTSIARIAQLRFPLFPAEMAMQDRYESWKKITGIHTPLLVVHGDKDYVIPTSHGKDLFELANEPKTFKLIEGGGHSDLFERGFGATSLDWLAELAKKS